MLFIEYPKCTTCQKAKKFLVDNGVDFTARHIKEENPTYDELKLCYDTFYSPNNQTLVVSGKFNEKKVKKSKHEKCVRF